MTYIITYGWGHNNYKGESLRDCYSIVETLEDVTNIRGPKWANCYANEKDAGVEEYNLKLVPLTAHVDKSHNVLKDGLYKNEWGHKVELIAERNGVWLIHNHTSNFVDARSEAQLEGLEEYDPN